jgi:hypothetical protein
VLDVTVGLRLVETIDKESVAIAGTARAATNLVDAPIGQCRETLDGSVVHAACIVIAEEHHPALAEAALGRLRAAGDTLAGRGENPRLVEPGAVVAIASAIEDQRVLLERLLATKQRHQLTHAVAHTHNVVDRHRCRLVVGVIETPLNVNLALLDGIVKIAHHIERLALQLAEILIEKGERLRAIDVFPINIKLAPIGSRSSMFRNRILDFVRVCIKQRFSRRRRRLVGCHGNNNSFSDFVILVMMWQFHTAVTWRPWSRLMQQRCRRLCCFLLLLWKGPIDSFCHGNSFRGFRGGNTACCRCGCCVDILLCNRCAMWHHHVDEQQQKDNATNSNQLLSMSMCHQWTHIFGLHEFPHSRRNALCQVNVGLHLTLFVCLFKLIHICIHMMSLDIARAL